MESSNVLGALRRRAYLIPAGVMLTGGLCFAAAQAVPAKYEAKANLLLLPPSSVGEIGGNPYLALGGLDPAAAVLGRAMTDSRRVKQLRRAGSTGEFTVEQDLATSGPVLLVTVTDRTPAGSLKSLDLVLSQVPRTLYELQQSIDAPRRSFIQTSVINLDRKSQVNRKSQIRAILVAGAVGFSAALSAIALFDSFMVRRRRAGENPRAEIADSNEVPASESVTHIRDLSPPPGPGEQSDQLRLKGVPRK